MPEDFHAWVLGGTHSGAGKTLWSMALLALARRRGLDIQPFKAGPDYIDPGFHDSVCIPRKSRNLDFHLMTPEIIRETFACHSAKADAALIEGVMGLFDGKRGEEGATARLAKFLKLPVFLVIDGAGMASSAAAIALGFREYDPDLNIAGIFFNRVNTENHFRWLRESVESRTGIPCLGFLPSDDALKVPERHLGLTTADEYPDARATAEKAADFLEARIDWDRLMDGSRVDRPVSLPAHTQAGKAAVRIGVARDEAFSFYYEDNFDLLRRGGAEILFFSPLKDKQLPAGVSLLWFGGGFPEFYAGKLSGNHDMMSAIQNFYRDGGYIYAECGGFVFLTEAFCSSTGERFPLAGLIPGTVRMTDRLQYFGYKDLEVLIDNFIFNRGTRLRSHEFHYSVWENSGHRSPVYRAGDRDEGYAAPRLIASYQHLHFAAVPDLVSRFLRLPQKEMTHA